jgi:hypothetical protein
VPNVIDFSCGRQSSFPFGTRSRIRRVVVNSGLRSVKRREKGVSFSRALVGEAEVVIDRGGWDIGI